MSVELRITAAFIIGMIIGAVALTCFAIVMTEDKICKGEKPKPVVCRSCRNFDTCEDKPLPPGMQCLGWEPKEEQP